MRGSLFGRLLLTLLASALVLWGVAIGVAVYRIDDEVANIHDRQLSQTAQVLLALAGQEIVEHLAQGDTPPAQPTDAALPLAELGAHLMRYSPEHGLAFHVEAKGVEFYFRSANFPQNFASPHPPFGYANVVANGARWRVYTGSDETDTVRVQVAQREAERDRLAVGIMRGFVPPLLVGLVITVLATVVHVRHARRPLAELATALAKRDPDSLEPLTLVRPAREIAPIAAALNHLIIALRDRIGRERRFIADAAHELRTPLASIQTGADVALELDGEPRREALLGLRAGASRAARLVGQLMTLARIEPLSTIAESTPFDLGACVESIMAELAPSASKKKITISLKERAPAQFRGQRALVEVLVRNLVENAIRYTPSGGQVRVSTDSVPGTVVLKVEDSGPGIPEANRKRVFERFYRGTQGAGPGSGLGLSISARIATLHGAEIELGDSPLGGLTATVCFASGSEPASLGDARTQEPTS